MRLLPALLGLLLTVTATALPSVGADAEAPPRDGDSAPRCDITVTGRHGGASGEITVDFSESQVRTRVGWWASLARGGDTAQLTLRPGEDFSEGFDLRLGCSAHRRYRFVFTHEGTDFTYVYPSEDDFTQEQTLDLGAVSRFFGIPPADDVEPPPVTLDGLDLDGEWVRSESNNDPNDGMRIVVEGDRATITSVPETAGSAWREGETIWREIEGDGALRVLGSDDNYYAAELTAEGTQKLTLSIQHGGAGNDQTWVRHAGCWPEAYMAAYGERTPGMWVRSSSGIPAGFRESLQAARDAGAAIQTAALTPDGEWVVVAANQPCYSARFPEDARTPIDRFVDDDLTIDAVAFSSGGQWIVIAEDAFAHEGVGEATVNWVQRLQDQGKRFDAVALAREGSALVSEGTLYTFGQVPDEITEAAAAARTGRRAVHDVAIGTDGQWVLVAGDWFVSTSAPLDLFQQLHRYRTDEDRRIDHVVLDRTDTSQWALVSNHPEPDPTTDADEMERFMGPDSTSIWERMKAHDVRALAVAVVEGNEIAWARGYGFRAVGGAADYERYVYPSTIFDAASVSKPVAAVGALQLVDDGRLSLTDGSLLQSLIGTVVPVAFGPGIVLLDPGGDVNLARLLSHCAGLDHRHGGSGAQERDPDKNEIPIHKVVLGLPPAGINYGAVRSFTPGDSSHYSGANYALVQALIEAHADGGFNEHMRALFDDLEMIDSSFRPAEERAERYAYGYAPDDDDCGSSCPVYAYPNKAAAGLTTTVMDLARFVIMLNHDGRYSGQVLSGPTVARMLKVDAAVGSSLAEQECADLGTMGLGMRVGNRGDDDEMFWHGGLHNGFRAGIYGYPRADRGLIFLMTGDRDDTSKLRAELRDRFNAVYL